MHIARLPREIFYANGFVNPARRGLFDVLNKRRQRVRRAQTNQQVNVVSHTSDEFGNSVRGANQSAKVFMQTISPFIRDERMPVFRAEHDMEMQA